MAHYAFLDKNNIVTEVIVGRNENDGDINWEEWYSNYRGQKCVRTSYNGTIRKNYAGIGYKYDEEKDVFIPPKPFSKWILNGETCNWEAPIAYPEGDTPYIWNDNKGEWEAVS